MAFNNNGLQRKTINREVSETTLAVVAQRPAIEIAITESQSPIMFDGTVNDTVDQVRALLRDQIINESYNTYCQANEDRDPDSLMTKEEFAARFVLGKDAEPDQIKTVKMFEAHLNTRIARFFMNAQERSNMAFRFHAYEVYMSGQDAWKFDDGIVSFEKWVRATAPEAWATSRFRPSIVFITLVLPFVAGNEMMDDEDQLITVERMCGMFDKSMEAYSYVAKTLIKAIQEEGDPDKQDELFLRFRRLTINALKLKANVFVASLKAGVADTEGDEGDSEDQGYVIAGLTARRYNTEEEAVFVIRAANQNAINRIQGLLASLNGEFSLADSIDSLRGLLTLISDDEEDIIDMIDLASEEFTEED